MVCLVGKITTQHSKTHLRNATYIFDGASLQHMQRSRHSDLHSLKTFMATIHLTSCLFTHRPRFFVARRTVTNLSFLSASIQHVLFCCNSPLGLIQNFLENCLRLPRGMFRQAFCDLISCIDPSQIGRLDYGQLNRQSLVCRRWCCSFFVNCIVKALVKELF